MRDKKIRHSSPKSQASCLFEDTELRNAACFLLFVFLCVAVALLTTTFPNHRRNCELVAKSAQLRREITELCEDNEARRAQIEALKSDPFYMEAVARKKYKLIKAGETLIELTPSSDSR